MPSTQSQKSYKKAILFSAALLLLAASFFIGAWYGYEHRPAVEKVLNVAWKMPPPGFGNDILLSSHQDADENRLGVDFSLFWEVWSRLEKQYVDRAKVDRKQLVQGAIEGLVRGIGDPYTAYLPPAETKQFNEDISGSFGGIGAEIGIRKGLLTVIAPLKGSPAERAGLLAGDKILQINSTSTADLALDEAVRLIRGEQGSRITLTIYRTDLDKTKEVTLIRDVIRVPVLTTEKKPHGIFVIHLHHFTQNADVEFRSAVEEFYVSNSKRLILDLRNNPGGYLTVAVNIASWFVPAGEVVTSERLADGEGDVYRSSGFRLLERIPTVVLVNGGSASASEILAAALRDHHGIKLIGEKTFGKGSVQEVEELPDHSSLKITIAKWLTPKKQEIDGKGLDPDIVVAPAKDDKGEIDLTKDTAMEKAIEVVGKL